MSKTRNRFEQLTLLSEAHESTDANEIYLSETLSITVQSSGPRYKLNVCFYVDGSWAYSPRELNTPSDVARACSKLAALDALTNGSENLTELTPARLQKWLIFRARLEPEIQPLDLIYVLKNTKYIITLSPLGDNLFRLTRYKFERGAWKAKRWDPATYDACWQHYAEDDI